MGGFKTKRSLDDEDRRRLRVAIASLRRGDLEGLNFIYACYADNVFSYVATIVSGHHDAEDVTQQVFAKLPKKIHRYEERAVPFSAWIIRVARNAAIDSMRTNKRLLPCEEVRVEAPPSDEVGGERRRDLSAALAELPIEQRQVLMMRHLVGLSPGEIAVKLKRSEGSIHGLHHRGRRTLQRKLDAAGAAPALAA